MFYTLRRCVKMAAEANFGTLPIAHFPFEGKATDGHVHVLSALKDAGVPLKELRQVDLHGNPGIAVLTFSCLAERDSSLNKELEIGGTTVQLLPGDGRLNTMRAYVYGCPTELHDSVILSVLQRYGKPVGPVIRKCVQFESFSVQTGVRVVTLMSSSFVSLPCKIQAKSLNLRLWHKGQVQTCYHCRKSGHVVRDCPERVSPSKASQENSSSTITNTSEVITEVCTGVSNGTTVPDSRTTLSALMANVTTSSASISASDTCSQIPVQAPTHPSSTQSVPQTYASATLGTAGPDQPDALAHKPLEHAETVYIDILDGEKNDRPPRKQQTPSRRPPTQTLDVQSQWAREASKQNLRSLADKVSRKQRRWGSQ